MFDLLQIIGAGILHGEKSPAVQAVMASPLLSSINITHSAHDGINLISPSKTMNMLYNKVTTAPCPEIPLLASGFRGAACV